MPVSSDIRAGRHDGGRPLVADDGRHLDVDVRGVDEAGAVAAQGVGAELAVASTLQPMSSEIYAQVCTGRASFINR